MQLRPVDKALYQKRHKRVVIGLIASLAILSLVFSTTLIELYGNSEAGSNTLLNAAGVLLAVVILAITVHQLKQKPYFEDIAYVWALKQELTQINRRITKIKAAAEQGDVNAMIILNYCYNASEHVWQLENNTLVMEELRGWQSDLDQLQNKYNVEVLLTDYRRDLLSNY